MDVERRLLRRRLAAEAQQAVAQPLTKRLLRAGDRCKVAHLLPAGSVEQADRGLRISERRAVLDRVLECRHAPGAIDVRKHRPLFNDLPAKRGSRLVMRAPVYEAQDRKVGQQRQQPGEQCDPDARRQVG